jgi:transposase
MESEERRYSRVGRPRALTEAQIAGLREWHDARVTLKELCDRLGVSTATARKAIAGFHYKSPPPELRPERGRSRSPEPTSAPQDAGR